MQQHISGDGKRVDDILAAALLVEYWVACKADPGSVQAMLLAVCVFRKVHHVSRYLHLLSDGYMIHENW